MSSSRAITYEGTAQKVIGLWPFRQKCCTNSAPLAQVSKLAKSRSHYRAALYEGCHYKMGPRVLTMVVDGTARYGLEIALRRSIGTMGAHISGRCRIQCVSLLSSSLSFAQARGLTTRAEHVGSPRTSSWRKTEKAVDLVVMLRGFSCGSCLQETLGHMCRHAEKLESPLTSAQRVDVDYRMSEPYTAGPVKEGMSDLDPLFEGICRHG